MSLLVRLTQRGTFSIPKPIPARALSNQASTRPEETESNWTAEKPSTASASESVRLEGSEEETTRDPLADGAKEAVAQKQEKEKTQLELDEQVRQKLEGISGEGGPAGLEYEDGKATSMKRGVRNNMFRYI